MTYKVYYTCLWHGSITRGQTWEFPKNRAVIEHEFLSITYVSCISIMQCTTESADLCKNLTLCISKTVYYEHMISTRLSFGKECCLGQRKKKSERKTLILSRFDLHPPLRNEFIHQHQFNRFLIKNLSIIKYPFSCLQPTKEIISIETCVIFQDLDLHIEILLIAIIQPTYRDWLSWRNFQ